MNGTRSKSSSHCSCVPKPCVLTTPNSLTYLPDFLRASQALIARHDIDNLLIAALAKHAGDHGHCLGPLLFRQVAEADVAAVEATLAQAQATLPPLQKQLAVQRDLLTALIGRFPSREPAEKFELASLQLPQ